jgi:hypothetical protein
MAEKEKSFDLLGLKGTSDSLKIVTQFAVDGAKALLTRICLPAAEEYGLLLKDKVSSWRQKNVVLILNKANNLINSKKDKGKIHPRLAHEAIEIGSWTDDEIIQNYWAGLLASGTSKDGDTDENLIFMNLLKQMSSLEVRILSFCVEKSKKYDSGEKLPLAESYVVSIKKLKKLFNETNLIRLDRELDHLREIGLIEEGIGSDSRNADLVPSALGIYLYVRAQGSKKNPVEYFNLKQKPTLDSL